MNGNRYGIRVPGDQEALVRAVEPRPERNQPSLVQVFPSDRMKARSLRLEVGHDDRQGRSLVLLRPGAVVDRDADRRPGPEKPPVQTQCSGSPPAPPRVRSASGRFQISLPSDRLPLPGLRAQLQLIEAPARQPRGGLSGQASARGTPPRCSTVSGP